MLRLATVGLMLVLLATAIAPAIANEVAPAGAAAHHDDGHQLHVHPISVAPFVILLLCIAILPLVAGHFWHSNLKKLLVSLGLATPVLIYLLMLGPLGTHKLVDAVLEYAMFIALLGSLYTVSGGIVLEGDLRPSATVNVGFLLVGAVLANFIGTTGASMLLIRPYLKINALRYKKSHLPVFFIFLVSNLGGLLTPLGDPPLFLGFLRGVDFFWTLSLWPIWLVACGVVAAVFFLWDAIALSREPKHEMENLPGVGPVRLLGKHNFVYLAGILAMILFLSPAICAKIGIPSPIELACRILGMPQLGPTDEVPMSVFAVRALLFVGPMAVLSGLSMLTTSRQLRKENDFSWGAILEVAALFIGIFIAMVPALALLETDGEKLGIDSPAKFFWATGMLSSFLDNAPTYVSFATLAAHGTDFAVLMQPENALILKAISAGAVLMGANTYIGNGPNFMVKAIADESGYQTPSFFGYMLYSGLILLPTFGLITYLFFV